MNKLIKHGAQVIDSADKIPGKATWSLKEKLLLGLSTKDYLAQAVRNPVNWVLAVIFAIGVPIFLLRFVFGLSYVTHSSNDYPWGLFLGMGLFAMVPLSSSGFQLGTAVEIFGRHDLEPVERLGLLNGLLGYFFAVIFLMADLGQPWRLPYPMAVAFGPAAVLFLVAWHVATYLSVQVAEVSVAFFEWIGFPAGKKAIRKITLGLTVSGIILSTLHQGALGALFTYAPGKVHPLWYSASFQWIHFFVSSLPAGLCMVIAVSTIARKGMGWRCDETFKKTIDKLTITLSRGASMGLITYFVIKMIGIAHDNKWEYLGTGFGQWFMVEMAIAVIIPLVLFAYGISNKKVGLIRLGAFMVVFGTVLNRVNTSILTFNWKMAEREIPHWREVVIVLTIYAIYFVVYRFILYRLPILFSWKTAEVPVLAEAPARAQVAFHGEHPATVGLQRSSVQEQVSTTTSYNSTDIHKL